MPPARDDRARTVFNTPGLVVTGASAEHMLAMKIDAARSKRSPAEIARAAPRSGTAICVHSRWILRFRVSVDDDWDVVRAFLEHNPVDYRVALADTAERLVPFGPITVLPTTWLMDRRGRLAATHVGLVDRAVLSWTGCGLNRTPSSTATRKSPEARPFFAARGCRFSLSSTTWRAERLSTISSISSRPCRRNRHSLRWIWRAIPFWPVRVLLDENLPRALAAELTGHHVSSVQAEGWSGTKNGALLRRLASTSMPC